MTTPPNFPNQQYLLSSLMNMYNNNNRQIENLQNANNEIRNDITNLLMRNNNNNNNNRQRNSNLRNQNLINRNNIRNDMINNNDLNIPISNLSSTVNSIFQNFLDPVQIFPTQIQIENATRIVRFADIVRPINNSCPITLDNFGDNNSVSVIRHCNHIFNTDALNNWFRSNCRCPVCRYDIRIYNTPNTNNSPNTNNIPNTNNTPNTNNSPNIPNISNIQYDNDNGSVTFDINSDEFYNNIAQLAMNRFNTLYNNIDASGNNTQR
jgi:hypothetical protein